MSTCNECDSERIASVTAKCSDRCAITIGDAEHEGYVPSGMEIGGGDYVEFSYCLDCGRIQGEFPLEETDLELGVESEEADEDWDDEESE